jgi:hypothetical protein
MTSTLRPAPPVLAHRVDVKLLTMAPRPFLAPSCTNTLIRARPLEGKLSAV